MRLAMYPTSTHERYSRRIRIGFEASEYAFLAKDLKNPKFNFSGSAEEGLRIWFSEDEGNSVTKVGNSRQWAVTVASHRMNVNPVRGRVRSFKVDSTMHSSATGRELKVKPFLLRLGEYVDTPSLRTEKQQKLNLDKPGAVKTNPFNPQNTEAETKLVAPSPVTLIELIEKVNSLRKSVPDVIFRVNGEGDLVALREVVSYEPL